MVSYGQTSMASPAPQGSPTPPRRGILVPYAAVAVAVDSGFVGALIREGISAGAAGLIGLALLAVPPLAVKAWAARIRRD